MADPASPSAAALQEDALDLSSPRKASSPPPLLPLAAVATSLAAVTAPLTAAAATSLQQRQRSVYLSPLAPPSAAVVARLSDQRRQSPPPLTVKSAQPRPLSSSSSSSSCDLNQLAFQRIKSFKQQTTSPSAIIRTTKSKGLKLNGGLAAAAADLKVGAQQNGAGKANGIWNLTLPEVERMLSPYIR